MARDAGMTDLLEKLQESKNDFYIPQELVNEIELENQLKLK